MSLTQYAAAALLNSLFGKTSDFGALASAPDLFLAASTSTPAEDGTNITEPSGNNYSRLDVGGSDFDAATDADPSEIDNTGTLSFPTASGSWGTITHVVLFDASSGGNAIAVYALSASKAIGASDTLEFAAGDLSLTLD